MKEERIFKLTQDVIEECLEESIEKPEVEKKNSSSKRIA
ncbi:hypothetical protein BD780_000483 [Clostridium tetanomorphum]|nr:hypothetical protein [Clostridium tetanomorphum]NRS83258.1 hypothetical protein [Clostridium tetanomorphum]NRZ98644.1 hypothetical protein [Clostridium tetanomorphum]SQC01305.1 Uncharacterised protein [Clostridium tetanomorphum]